MRFTYYTIIGRDPKLLEGHLNNITEYAGFNKLTCEKELLIVIYKNNKIPEEVTNNILAICDRYKAKYIIYEESNSTFIENLYACWNLGYEASKQGYVFRGGSDQVFSKDSFLYLYEEAEKLRLKDEKFVLQANTIENKKRIDTMGGGSRHFLCDFGESFNDFNFMAFEDFISTINSTTEKNILDINDCLKLWGKPTEVRKSLLGVINRVDGCSWLMTKKDWENFGPLPSKYKGVTGDVVIHDILQVNGYKEFIVKDCVTYHFVRGESVGYVQ